MCILFIFFAVLHQIPLAFLHHLVFFLNPRRPSRSSNLVPRLAVVGVTLWLSSRTASSLNKKYFDYDYAFPPMESHHRKGPCRTRDRGVFS